MPLGRHRYSSPDTRVEEIGVSRYTENDAEIIDASQSEDAMAVVASAINSHHRRIRRRSIATNYHTANDYPKERPPRLVLPRQMDPHRPAIQLARAGIRDFGVASVVSMDTTVPLTSNRGVERAEEWIGDINKWVSAVNRSGAQNADPGLVILVERSEDENNPRLQELQGAIGNLAIPHLTLVTTADPNSTPLYEDLSLADSNLAPPLRDDELRWLRSA
jgi:hypothetical protein